MCHYGSNPSHACEKNFQNMACLKKHPASKRLLNSFFKRTAILVSIGYMTLLAGCASLSDALPGFGAHKQPEENVAKEKVKAPAPPAASFRTDTLYDLLVAEMAAYDKRYDLTLGNYLQQAHKTEDPGVTERAYQVASYLNARQAASDAARLWIRIAPENPDAIRAFAIEEIWGGAPLAALAALEKVRQETGEAPFDFLASRSGTLTQEARAELLKEFNRLLARWPDDDSLQLGKVMLLEMQGEKEASLALLDQLIRRSGEDAQNLLLKARVLADMDRPEQTLALLKRAVKSFPQAPRLRLFYGRQLVKSGDLPGAQKEFEVLVEQHPGSPELLLSVGLVAMENGMFGEAGFYFHRLSKIPGRSSVADYYLGRLAEQMDDWKEGRKYFLQVKPGAQFLPAYGALVRMLSDHEQWHMAQHDLQDARKNYPDYAPQLYLMEGEVSLELRDYKGAADIYDKALLTYADHTSLLYARAMLAEKLDDLQGLEQHLRKLLVLEPKNAAALNALGYILVDRTARIDEGAALIAQAYKLDPDDPSIIDSMGWAEFRLGRYEQSLKFLKKAYALFPDAEIAAHLGELLWVMGNKQDAAAIWDKALEQQADSEVLKATVERLNAAE